MEGVGILLSSVAGDHGQASSHPKDLLWRPPLFQLLHHRGQPW
jgi:hypothetical protein